MKTQFVCAMLGLCLSQAVMANLNGEWSGGELAKATLKTQGFSKSTFGMPQIQLTVDIASKTMTFTDDLGSNNCTFSENIKTKSGLVQQHTFSCKFNKAVLQESMYNKITSQLGASYLISNLSISATSVSGQELNETTEDTNEGTHALRGTYRIKVNFMAAQSINPSRKIPFSLAFVIDFGLFHPSLLQTALSTPVQHTSLFENTAELIKQLFQQ